MAKIEATGNLGGDPEVRFTNSGTPVMNFSFCDSKSKKDQNGDWQVLKEQWLRVTVWGPFGEYLSSQIHKGSRVTVYGEFYAEEFERKDGTKGTGLSVTADAVKVWPPKNNNGGNNGGFGGQQQAPQQPQQGHGLGQAPQQQAPQGDWGQQQQPMQNGWPQQGSNPPF